VGIFGVFGHTFLYTNVREREAEESTAPWASHCG
jgi:hypothetical protein